MGTDYLRDLAEILEGKYVRDARDVGIIASLKSWPVLTSIQPLSTPSCANSTSTPRVSSST